MSHELWAHRGGKKKSTFQICKDEGEVLNIMNTENYPMVTLL